MHKEELREIFNRMPRGSRFYTVADRDRAVAIYVDLFNSQRHVIGKDGKKLFKWKYKLSSGNCGKCLFNMHSALKEYINTPEKVETVNSEVQEELVMTTEGVESKPKRKRRSRAEMEADKKKGK